MKSFWFISVFVLLAPSLHAEENTWTHNDAMLTYFQAASAIREFALEELDYADIVHTSLKTYLATHDSYSELFTPTEYAQYRTARALSYVGIGMELAQTKEGTIYCVPYPESSAARAGVREHDLLLAVNDQPVTQQTLESLSTTIRGEPGDTITLTLRAEGEDPRKVTAERHQVQARSVNRSAHEGNDILRIFTFNANTPGELNRAIRSLPEDGPILLDLRGNPGGNLFDAVDTARLFLGSGQTIVTVSNRTSSTAYRSERPAAFPDRPVWIFQDGGTASAGEVFVAALVDNGRARSVGRETFGKGRTQRVVELMDGSALLLTDAILIPPSGNTYDGIGLAPSIPEDDSLSLPALLHHITQSERP